MRRNLRRIFSQQSGSKTLLLCVAFLIIVIASGCTAVPGASGGGTSAGGTGLIVPKITVGAEQAAGPQDVSSALQIFFLLTALSFAPSILMLTTSFLRISIVLSFLRTALGTMSVPPNQVISGLALFLTIYIMSPVWEQANREGIQPYLHGEITQEEGMRRAQVPLRAFMLKSTRQEDLAAILSAAGRARPATEADVDTTTLIPAFVLSEMRTSYIMGFHLFLPFLAIDIFVAVMLLSLGMMMVPPQSVSLPLKLLVFVLVDGWSLVVIGLIQSFQ